MFELIPFTSSRRGVDRYFDDFEKSFFDAFATPYRQGFRTDVIDNGDSFTLEAELPGFEKKDISLSLEKGVLTVSAVHNENKEDKKNDFVRRERVYGAVSRSFDVSGIDEEKISADYVNGVLKINMPKIEEKKSSKREITIS